MFLLSEIKKKALLGLFNSVAEHDKLFANASYIDTFLKDHNDDAFEANENLLLDGYRDRAIPTFDKMRNLMIAYGQTVKLNDLQQELFMRCFDTYYHHENRHYYLNKLGDKLNAIILEKAVESTTSAYCTDSSRLFDDFSPHRMGDTASVKNHQKVSKNQHIRHSRYDSTAFSRIIESIKSNSQQEPLSLLQTVKVIETSKKLAAAYPPVGVEGNVLTPKEMITTERLWSFMPDNLKKPRDPFALEQPSIVLLAPCDAKQLESSKTKAEIENALRFDTTKAILLPICVNAHWRLLEMKKPQNWKSGDDFEVKLFDTIGTDHAKLASGLVGKFFSATGIKGDIEYTQPSNLQQIDKGDGYSCGDGVIARIHQICKDNNQDYDKGLVSCFETKGGCNSKLRDYRVGIAQGALADPANTNSSASLYVEKDSSHYDATKEATIAHFMPKDANKVLMYKNIIQTLFAEREKIFKAADTKDSSLTQDELLANQLQKEEFLGSQKGPD